MVRRAQVNGWGQLIVACSTGAVLLTDDVRNPSRGCCPCFTCEVLATAAAEGRLKYEFSGQYISPGPPGAFQVTFPIAGVTYPDRVKPGIIVAGDDVIMQKLDGGGSVIDEANVGAIHYQCCQASTLYTSLSTPVYTCAGDLNEVLVTRPWLVAAKTGGLLGTDVGKFLFGVLGGTTFPVVRGARAASGQSEWSLTYTGQFTTSLGDSRIRGGQLCRMFID